MLGKYTRLASAIYTCHSSSQPHVDVHRMPSSPARRRSHRQRDPHPLPPAHHLYAPSPSHCRAHPLLVVLLLHIPVLDVLPLPLSTHQHTPFPSSATPSFPRSRVYTYALVYPVPDAVRTRLERTVTLSALGPVPVHNPHPPPPPQFLVPGRVHTYISVAKAPKKITPRKLAFRRMIVLKNGRVSILRRLSFALRPSEGGRTCRSRSGDREPRLLALWRADCVRSEECREGVWRCMLAWGWGKNGEEVVVDLSKQSSRIPRFGARQAAVRADSATHGRGQDIRDLEGRGLP